MLKQELESKIKTMTEYKEVLQSQIRYYEGLVIKNDSIIKALKDEYKA